MITPENLKLITVLIKCGSETGTGFFISTNHILTAAHVVDECEDEEITISHQGRVLEGKRLDHIWLGDIDVALLEVVEEIQIEKQILGCIYIPFNSKCFFGGYLVDEFKYKEGFIRYSGALEENCFEINVVTNDQESSYKGLSGSPLIFQGKIVGIVKTQTNNRRINSVSFWQIRSFLKKNGLNTETEVLYEKNLKLNVHDLGERYTQKLPNFELPVVKVFDALSRSNTYQLFNKTKFHDFLKSIDFNGGSIFRYIEDGCKSIKNDLQIEYLKTNWEIGKNINYGKWVNSCQLTYDVLVSYSHEIFKEQKDELKKNNNIDYWARPYQRELYQIQKIQEALSEFTKFVKGAIFKTSDKDCLILEGKAGVGKSHLLADIALKRLVEGFCSILILGQKLKKERDIWGQILIQAGFDGTKEAFLQELNEIGRWQENAVLFIIDGINEGDGRYFWEGYLNSFIQDFQKYKYIKLVLSIRSTYKKIIIPESVENNPQVLFYEHLGFTGYEVEAVNHFCRYFGLEAPQVPVLAPEFSNPQFLLILCSTLQSQGQNSFPEGSSGIHNVYMSYLQSVNKKLSRANQLNYVERLNLVEKAVLGLSGDMVNGWIPYADAVELLRESESKSNIGEGRLLEALINENILSRELIYDGYSTDGEDSIGFIFEWFSEHLLVKKLLDEHFDAPQNLVNSTILLFRNMFSQPAYVPISFTKRGFFYQYFKLQDKDLGHLYINQGLFNALAIQLPEKFSLELYEVLNERNLGESDFSNKVLDYIIRPAFLKSLLWRTKESIDLSKIEPYIYELTHSNKRMYLGGVNILLQLAAIPNHPLNADVLHSHLILYDIPNRDSWWLELIYTEIESEEKTYLQRLLEITSRNTIKLSKESKRLCSVVLSWCLGSPNREIRDNATKSIICLLDNCLDLILELLVQFESVKDAYIQERLYGIAYGCILRSNGQNIDSLVNYVYERHFIEKELPINILWRGYIQNILEYGFKHGALNIESLQFIMPPYNTNEPPSLEDSEFEVMRNTMQAVYSSILGGLADFSNYIIEPTLQEFYGISRNKEEKYKIYEKDLTPSVVLLVHEVKSMVRWGCSGFIAFLQRAKLNDLKFKFPYAFSKYSFEEIMKHIDNILYNKRNELFDFLPYKKWILGKVAEIGWEEKLHKGYERHCTNNDAIGQRHERIGKKYQWMAFYEAVGIVADNYYYKKNGEKTYLTGTWQLELFDIDPSIITKRSKQNELLSRIDMNIADDDWLEKQETLPDFKNDIIMKKDQAEWFNLNMKISEMEAPLLGEDFHSRSTDKRRFWVDIRSFFLRKEDKEDIIAWLKKQNFDRGWLPESPRISSIFGREYYWSDAYEEAISEKTCYRNPEDGTYYYEKKKREWEVFYNRMATKTRKPEKEDPFDLLEYLMSKDPTFEKILEGMPEDSTYDVKIEDENESEIEDICMEGHPTIIKHHFGSDKTNCVNQIYYPAEIIYNNLELQYHEDDGKFMDSDETIVCFDPSVELGGANSFLIKKDSLIQFLEKSDLAICWTVWGEKQIFLADGTFNIITFSGVYTLDSSYNLVGGIFYHGTRE